MLLVSVIFFLALTAFFTASEIAFITANKLSVEIKKSRGSTIGKIISSFLDKPDEFISVIQVGMNISIVILTYRLTELLSSVFNVLPFQQLSITLLNTFFVTVIILIFGEFLPKAFSRLYANVILNWFAYPLLFFYKLLSIPAFALNKISQLILKYLLKESVTKTRHRFNSMDLEHYIQGPVRIAEEELDADIFKNALQLKQIRVVNCMVPRTELVYVDVNDSIAELTRVFAESNLSRIIVVDGDIDNILGYVHHQQMFKKPTDIRSILFEMPFVPEPHKVYDLMLRMNKLGVSIACVVDEYGGTSGIVTLEDILEEIFGEIKDEHDSENLLERQITENEFIFSGRLELQYLQNEYDIALPQGDYHTLSGYIVMTTGRIPSQGEEIVQDGYRFVVEMVTDTRIETIRLIRASRLT